MDQRTSCNGPRFAHNCKTLKARDKPRCPSKMASDVLLLTIAELPIIKAIVKLNNMYEKYNTLYFKEKQYSCLSHHSSVQREFCQWLIDLE